MKLEGRANNSPEEQNKINPKCWPHEIYYESRQLNLEKPRQDQELQGLGNSGGSVKRGIDIGKSTQEYIKNESLPNKAVACTTW